MRFALDDVRWTSPFTLGLLAGAGGLFIAGPVGGLVGVLAGMAGARQPQGVILAAALALLLTAAFTVLEEPLSVAQIPAFPVDHSLADLAGKVTAVLLLAGLIGVLASLGFPTASRMPAEELEDAAVDSVMRERFPSSTVAAVLTVALLGSLVLWQVGDQRWHWTAPAVVLTVTILAFWRASKRLPSSAER